MISNHRNGRSKEKKQIHSEKDCCAGQGILKNSELTSGLLKIVSFQIALPPVLASLTLVRHQF